MVWTSDINRVFVFTSAEGVKLYSVILVDRRRDKASACEVKVELHNRVEKGKVLIIRFCIFFLQREEKSISIN